MSSSPKPGDAARAGDLQSALRFVHTHFMQLSLAADRVEALLVALTGALIEGGDVRREDVDRRLEESPER